VLCFSACLFRSLARASQLHELSFGPAMRLLDQAGITRCQNLQAQKSTVSDLDTLVRERFMTFACEMGHPPTPSTGRGDFCLALFDPLPSGSVEKRTYGSKLMPHGFISFRSAKGAF
jgi:hypothetical protein